MAATVQQLNEIQRDWMALQENDSNVDEVTRAMAENYPSVYLSGSAELDMFNVLYQGSPRFANPMKLEDAKRQVAKAGGRTDIAWDGRAGLWVEV